MAIPSEEMEGLPEIDMQDVSDTDFLSAFVALQDIPVSYVRMLTTHSSILNEDITASEMARAVGYKNFNAANLHYGKLGKRLANSLGIDIDENYCVFVLATFEYDGHEWHWIMRPQVKQALSQVRWVSSYRVTHMHAIRR